MSSDDAIWTIRITSSTAGTSAEDAFSTFLAQLATGHVVTEIIADDPSHPHCVAGPYVRYDSLAESRAAQDLGLCGLGLIEMALASEMTGHGRLALKAALHRLLKSL